MGSRFRWGKFAIVIVAIVAAITFLSTAAAQKANVPRAQDRLAMGEENVKQLLLLMDSDKNGMVSREAYMKFMEAEFARLDAENRGRLNAKQLTQSKLSASSFVGK